MIRTFPLGKRGRDVVSGSLRMRDANLISSLFTPRSVFHSSILHFYPDHLVKLLEKRSWQRQRIPPFLDPSTRLHTLHKLLDQVAIPAGNLYPDTPPPHLKCLVEMPSNVRCILQASKTISSCTSTALKPSTIGKRTARSRWRRWSTALVFL